MIANILFDISFTTAGITAYISIAVIYLIGFFICFFIPHTGMRKESWQKILEKTKIQLSNKDYTGQIAALLGTKAMANLLNRGNRKSASDALDIISATGAIITVNQIIGELGKNVKAIAAFFDVKLPKTKKYILSIVFIPIILLVSLYIPQYVSGKQQMVQNVQAASQTVYKLEENFKVICDSVVIDDPVKEYKDSGYYVIGNLYPSNNFLKSYISVIVNNDGQIEKVSYGMEVDITVSKEDNIEKINSDLMKLSRQLNAADVKALSPDLTKEYSLPAEFISEFTSKTYYEEFQISSVENMTINYFTEAEEDYDEYSDSTIYLTVAPR